MAVSYSLRFSFFLNFSTKIIRVIVFQCIWIRIYQPHPFTSCLGMVGFGSNGSGNTSHGGQVKWVHHLDRGLQACAGGVTGAVPHMVKKNNGSISNLFIILLHHNYWCNDSMKLTKVFLTIFCILAFFLFSHLARSDRISLCSISQLLQKSTV